jgi:hypothetical protein
MRVSFMLYAAIGIAVSIIVGYLASLIFPPQDPSRSNGLLWVDVVWRAWQRESKSIAATPTNAIPTEMSAP